MKKNKPRERRIEIEAVVDAYNAEELANLSKLGLLQSGVMNDLQTGRVRVPETIAVTG